MKKVPAKGAEGNFTGEGFIRGGVYVVQGKAAEGAAPVFAHAEDSIGDHPPLEELLAACKRASGGSSS